MKKSICILIIFLIIFIVHGQAQPCLPEGIEFETQEEIDNFHLNYPNCTEIEGFVRIYVVDGISNLNGLNGITKINGYLVIHTYFSSLSNLSGLDSLTRIGGDFVIDQNFQLIEITALNKLTEIGGSLLIEGNNQLFNLDGLNNLESLGGNLDLGGYVGESLQALSFLTQIDGDLNIIGSGGILTLEGLHNIDPNSIINLKIVSNSSLSECDVESICGYLSSPNGEVFIDDNYYGCNEEAEIIDSCNAQSIDALYTEEYINLFPNPAKDHLIIEMPRYFIGTIVISSSVGQILKTIPINTYKTKKLIIDCADFNTGIYFVTLNTDSVIFTKKLIIE